VVYPFRFYATSGGLSAYGPDQGDPFRRAAGYVDRTFVTGSTFSRAVFTLASWLLRYAARGNIVKTLIIKRSVVLDGHKTSVSLENEFWDGLQEIARSEDLKTSALVKRIAHNLSSAIRVFVFNHFRTRGKPAGESE
jgi:predicted DNA-binding ribbon-helix-helix protein